MSLHTELALRLARILVESAYPLPGGDFPDLDGAVAADGGQHLAAGGDREDMARPVSQFADQLPADGIPEIDVPLIIGRGDDLTLRNEGDTAELMSMMKPGRTQARDRTFGLRVW